MSYLLNCYLLRKITFLQLLSICLVVVFVCWDTIFQLNYFYKIPSLVSLLGWIGVFWVMENYFNTVALCDESKENTLSILRGRKEILIGKGTLFRDLSKESLE
ncbi:MAG: hypothetical protein IIT65_01490 [Lachnospiraceae bacterium]|nr:hypothetical protein [Lachnospiraceae bacterium]